MIFYNSNGLLLSGKKEEVQSPCGRFVYIEKWHLAARGQRNLFYLKKIIIRPFFLYILTFIASSPQIM